MLLDLCVYVNIVFVAVVKLTYFILIQSIISQIALIDPKSVHPGMEANFAQQLLNPINNSHIP